MDPNQIATKKDINDLKEFFINEVFNIKENNKSNPEEKDWLTSAEVMSKFGIKSANTLQHLKSKGLRPCKLGGKNLYYLPDIIKFIHKNK